MSKSIVVIDTPKTCGDCPFCIYTAEEKKRIGYCNTSDEDYYCKVLDRFMEYDEVDGGIDILGKPIDCPLKSLDELIKQIEKVGYWQPCEDAISRQAVLDYIRDNYRRWFINDDAFMQSVSGIKDIVPVTPAQKTGRLVDAGDGHSAECSECGRWFFHGRLAKKEINYCPDCGCRMEVI